MKTISEVRREGIQALTKTLGPVDMARFIQSFETGSGDYTKERHEWLPDQSRRREDRSAGTAEKTEGEETDLTVRLGQDRWRQTRRGGPGITWTGTMIPFRPSPPPLRPSIPGFFSKNDPCFSSPNNPGKNRLTKSAGWLRAPALGIIRSDFCAI